MVLVDGWDVKPPLPATHTRFKIDISQVHSKKVICVDMNKIAVCNEESIDEKY